MAISNTEPKNTNGGPLYPINSWTSIAYLLVFPLLINKSPVGALACFLIGIISFMWWCWQDLLINKIDLGLITFLFLWVILNELKVDHFNQLIILFLCIFSVLKFGLNNKLKFHTMSLVLSA